VSAAAATTQDPVEIFLAGLADELADLEPGVRGELLDDVRAHLGEVQAETGSLSASVGTPATYAAELRVAADLPVRPTTPAPPARLSLLAVLRASVASRWLIGFLVELRPAWWVARGALAGLGWWLAAQHRDRDALVHVRSGLVAGVLVGVGISVLLGVLARRGRSLWRGAGVAATLLALVLGVGQVLDLQHRLSTSGRSGWSPPPEPSPSAPPGSLSGPDGLVYNIFPYDSEGRLLTGVQLLDQAGRPLRIQVGQDIGGSPLTRRVPVGLDGQPLDNVFPQTQQTTGPGAGGAVAPPRAPASVAAVPTASQAVVPPGFGQPAPVLLPGPVPMPDGTGPAPAPTPTPTGR